MSRYWEEEVKMYSPKELDEYYASREDETVEQYFEERRKHNSKTTEFLKGVEHV